MPYTLKDVPKKDSNAKSMLSRKQWLHVYNSAKAAGRSDGEAIREADGVVKKRGGK